MIHNYHIIRQVTEEIRRRLIGLPFARAYSVHAHEIRIALGTEARSELLVARLAPGNGALHLAGRMHEAPKRNVASFFNELHGKDLADISIARYDRLLRLRFAGGYILYLRFYDRPNAILYHADEFIGSFKKTEATSPIIFDESDRYDTRSSLALLSAPLRKELALRNIDPERFETELRSSDRTYFYKRSGSLISPIKLTGLKEIPEEFGSSSEAIEIAIAQREKHKALEASRGSLLANVDHFIDKTSSARTEAERAISDSSRIERYTLIGQEILARASEFPRGATTVTYRDNDAERSAELDPALTAYENANRYFEKARTARARKDDVAKRIASLTTDETTLYGFRERIIEAQHPKELEQLRKDLAASRFTLHQAADVLEQTGPRYREYEVAGGFRVLVGKNAKQNDELTLHTAHKEDLWFHARHVSGSHVVLRSGKQSNIPPRAIEQAAELAAYFSDARSQKHAPVAYTRRKFVRKPRGAAAGAVLIEREEVIIVTPQISAQPITP